LNPAGGFKGAGDVTGARSIFGHGSVSPKRMGDRQEKLQYTAEGRTCESNPSLPLYWNDGNHNQSVIYRLWITFTLHITSCRKQSKV